MQTGEVLRGGIELIIDVAQNNVMFQTTSQHTLEISYLYNDYVWDPSIAISFVCSVALIFNTVLVVNR
jgi:hypothetical protein